MIYKKLTYFDLDKIAQSGQCFRLWQEGAGHFVVIAYNRVLHIENLENDIWAFSCAEDDFLQIWQNYFDLPTDYAQIESRISLEDTFLREAAAYSRGIRILHQDPWEMLITFLISQNNNIPRIRRSIELLCERYGGKIRDGEQEYFAFPRPEDLEQVTLDQLGMCNLGYRAKYIQHAVQSALSGIFDGEKLSRLGDKELKGTLLSLYGVGPKVADCIMLYGFHRLNAFPVDVWIKRVGSQVYNGNIPAQKDSDFAGVYQQYLFYFARKDVLNTGKYIGADRN